MLLTPRESKALLLSQAAMARMHLESARLGQMIANEEAERYRTDLVQWAKELKALGIFEKSINTKYVEISIISKITKYSVRVSLPQSGTSNLPYTIRRRPRVASM